MEKGAQLAYEMQATAGQDYNPSVSVHSADGADHVDKWHCHEIDVRADAPDKMARNQLIVVSVLCFLFMVGETIGGVLSNSLALFTDVLHLASDLISFLISLTAIYLARKPATKKMSFGYHRTEVIGALFSVFFIWAVTAILVYVASERIIGQHYMDVKPGEMLITAVLGVVFNIIMAIVLQSDICFGRSRSRPSFGHSHKHRSSKDHVDQKDERNGIHTSELETTKRSKYQTFPSDKDLQLSDDDKKALHAKDIQPVEKSHPRNINVRAAFIHVLGDILQSLGVLLASVIMMVKPEDKYKLADPICTFLFSILVLFTTVNVLRDALQIVLEGVPRDICYREVRVRLQDLPEVKAVHDLTLWSLTLEKNAISVHLCIDRAANHEEVLREAAKLLKEHYNFLHTTIQVEYYSPEATARCESCKK